jgi:flagellar hook-length control protein FliK
MNGDEMSSASIVMNLPVTGATAPPSSTAAGVEPAAAGTGGFDQALAAAQAEPASQAVVAQMLLLAGGPGESGGLKATSSTADEAEPDRGDAADAAQSGVAAILAQMLAGASPVMRNETPEELDAGLQQALLQPAGGWEASTLSSSTNSGSTDGDAEGEDASAPDQGDAAGKSVAVPSALELRKPDSVIAAAVTAAEKLPDAPSMSIELSPAPQSGNAVSAAVQAAVNAMRDSESVGSSPGSPHATLREPVGTARWADELGNRLVLMSVRGQQQGSLTLSPEHLGPMEVQISVSKDTANVWFGAQHADTRAALAEAMPRLRELLASSGLSLGQSGVSEQAPREAFSPPTSHRGSDPMSPDAAAVEASPTAWRRWNPGLLDTYA